MVIDSSSIVGQLEATGTPPAAVQLANKIEQD
jgi:hypothetical protein